MPCFFQDPICTDKPVAAKGKTAMPTTIAPATHRVILTYGTTSRVRYVSGGADGLRALAAEAAAAGVTSARAVVLDPAHAAYDTLFALGWAARDITPQECQHTSVTATANEADMDYRASCNTCPRTWSFEDPQLPVVVEQQALPEWERHGF
jgi:hypothetical protein